MRDAPHADPATHHDGADSAADRLKEAFATLTLARSKPGRAQNATVAELCRLAGISRNSLYRYHTGVLKALREYQCRRQGRQNARGNDVSESLRTENASLRGKLTKLAALIDHYYAAYRETSVLLERRDREIAALRRRLKVQPVPLKR